MNRSDCCLCSGKIVLSVCFEIKLFSFANLLGWQWGLWCVQILFPFEAPLGIFHRNGPRPQKLSGWQTKKSVIAELQRCYRAIAKSVYYYWVKEPFKGYTFFQMKKRSTLITYFRIRPLWINTSCNVPTCEQSTRSFKDIHLMASTFSVFSFLN